MPSTCRTRAPAPGHSTRAQTSFDSDLSAHKLEVEYQHDEKNEKDTDGAEDEALLVHPSRYGGHVNDKKEKNPDKEETYCPIIFLSVPDARSMFVSAPWS